MPKEQIPRAPTRLTARELTRKLPAPRKLCPLTTPRLLPPRRACLLIRLSPKERTRLNHHHHRTSRKPTARAREVDADLWRREQRMPHRRPAKEMLLFLHHQRLLRLPKELTPRCLHHLTQLLPNPRAETREVTPQPNLPRRKERQ